MGGGSVWSWAFIHRRGSCHFLQKCKNMSGSPNKGAPLIAWLVRESGQSSVVHDRIEHYGAPVTSCTFLSTFRIHNLWFLHCPPVKLYVDVARTILKS